MSCDWVWFCEFFVIALHSCIEKTFSSAYVGRPRHNILEFMDISDE